MTRTAKDMVAEARAKVASITPAAASEDQDALIIDIREAAELSATGTPPDAVHIPRGLLEFKADGSTDAGDKTLVALQNGKHPVHVLCASGGRAALAAAVLVDMGYDARIIEGGMTGWTKAGLPTKQV